MKVNHAVTAIALTLMTTSAAWAEKNNRGFYIGGDWGIFNETRVEVDDASAKENSDFGDFGYGLVVGYEFNTHQAIKLGLEAEYRQFAEISQLDSALQTEGTGIFVNIKPKFIVRYDEADVYVSFLAGIGSMDVTAKTSSSNASDSELGYQLGAELGVILNKDIDLHLGYRDAQVKFSDLDLGFSSVYTGIRYFF